MILSGVSSCDINFVWVSLLRAYAEERPCSVCWTFGWKSGRSGVPIERRSANQLLPSSRVSVSRQCRLQTASELPIRLESSPSPSLLERASQYQASQLLIPRPEDREGEEVKRDFLL